MLLSKKVALTAIALTFASFLVATTYASMSQKPSPPALGVEIALAKPFYIPAATGSRKMSAVVRAPVSQEYSGREITAVKLSPVMEGDKVRVTISALIGDVADIKNITSCKEWDALESVTVDTYLAGLDEEISVKKLRDYGVNFESGDLTFRIVPKKVFPQIPFYNTDGDDECECGSCGNLQCCPNPGYCIGCGVSCGQVCCKKGG